MTDSDILTLVSVSDNTGANANLQSVAPSEYRRGTQPGRPYLQDVADDSDAPHVRGEVDRVELDDFRRHKLRRSEEDARVLLPVELPGETEVDDLYTITGLRQAEDVLRLKECQRL